MAKISPAAPEADSVNNDAANAVREVVINAAPVVIPVTIPVATPENTPVPGGGRWRWNADRWAEVLEPATVTDPILE